MKILAIETAWEACSVALSIDGEVRERHAVAPRRHAELILPWVSELLAGAGIGAGGLDAIAFSRGPGSFTSLRIGIGVVQGLAWGAEVPVIPVSSLHATAQVAAASGMSAVIVAIDARMQEVYCQAFRLESGGVMAPCSEETVCAPALAAAFPAEGFSGVGNGFSQYRSLADFGRRLESVNPEVWPRAAVMPELARHWARDHEPFSAEMAQPVYLRDQVAQKPG